MWAQRLTAILLFLYPKGLRAAYREELILALRHAWQTERRCRPVVGAVLVVAHTIADAVRTRVGFRTESRWLRDHDRSRLQRPRLLYDWTGDLRLAIRALQRSPGFFGGVLITLALGIGANTAVFSLVRAVVLQPLPYERPDELVMIWRSPLVPGEFWRSATTPRFLLAWRERAADVMTVAGMVGIGSLDAQMDIVMPDGAERLRGAFATPNFFDVLGARPLHGRLFTSADETIAGTDVIVLAHSLWTRAFGRDPQVIGRTVTLSTGRGLRREARTFTVIGVLEPAFRFTYPDEVELWALRPWSVIAVEQQDAIGYRVVGRLRPGVSLDAASARFAALHDQIRPPRPDLPIELRQTNRVEPIHEWVVADTRRVMALLSGVSALLLVITCATAANALFVRVSERGREITLRAALGAGRLRLLRQLLLEGAVLVGAATAGGMTLAILLFPMLRSRVPASMPRANELGLDVSLFWFAAGVVAVVTILAALAPAWRASRLDIAAGLKRAAAAVSADRSTTLWRRALVGLQACVAAALLVGAGLLLWSFWRLTHVPLGFDADDVLTVEMRVLDRLRYRHVDQLRRLQDDLVARVAALSGVRAVAITSAVPFRGVDWTYNVELADTPGRPVSANGRHVDATYFAIMDIPLRHGRLFGPDDAAGTPSVAVVSEAFARTAFGTADPVGRVIEAVETYPSRVIGVVGDVRYTSLEHNPRPAIYLSRAQHPTELMCLLIDTSDASSWMRAAIRRAIRDVEPALPAMKFATIGDITRETLVARRFYTVVTAAFAGLALILALAGLATVIARTIVERRKELAIRMALGATETRLHARLIWDGLTPVIGGLAVGLVASLLIEPWLATLLFDTPARDSGVYAAVTMLIGLVSLGAAWITSRRGTTIQPATLLRDQ